MIIRCKNLLGTFVEIRAEENSYCAVEEAFLVIEEIHKMMNFFDENSEVSLLNREALQRPILVSSELIEVLNFAKKLYQVSDGIFDITLHRSGQKASFSDIEIFENNYVKFNRDLKIDLGGIAKGFAVDCAAKALEKYQVKNYLINAGGDLRVGNATQTISIRNPKNIHIPICNAEIIAGSLATSAGYFSSYKNNQKTLYPIFKTSKTALEYEQESASVFAKECMVADSLTKIALILKQESQKIIKAFQAEVMMVKASGEIYFIN